MRGSSVSIDAAEVGGRASGHRVRAAPPVQDLHVTTFVVRDTVILQAQGVAVDLSGVDRLEAYVLAAVMLTYWRATSFDNSLRLVAPRHSARATAVGQTGLAGPHPLHRSTRHSSWLTTA